MILVFLAALGGAAILYVSVFRDSDGADAVIVKRGMIIQNVVVTGKTKPISSVNLAFEKSGRAVRINVKVGDRVLVGQTLIATGASELAANLARAEASVAAAEAKLAEAKRGTRPEELAVQEAKTKGARVALEDAKKNLVDKLQDAYTKSDDAIRAKADQWFSNPTAQNPQVSFYADPGVKTSLERERPIIEALLTSWKSSSDGLSPASDLTAAVLVSSQNLAKIRLFLDTAALAINALKTGTGFSQTTIDGYRSDISTARTNINTAIANLSTADEKMKSAANALLIAENELTLSRAGSTQEEIASKEAAVREAEADAASLRADLAKTVLTAPLAGIVTKVDADPGEIMSAGVPVVSIISENQLEIEVNVPEVNVGRIAVGNPVKIALDALPDETFSGKVVSIEPAETIVDGVVNFKVAIVFDAEDGRFKSGLTANLSIETLRKPDVLLLPQFAVNERGGKVFVQKLVAGKAVETEVTLGARGEDGAVEIISGLKEGDRVIVLKKQ